MTVKAWFIALVVSVCFGSACTTANQQLESTIKKQTDANTALAAQQQRQSEKLFNQCMADERDYFKHPKPPLLRSCLEYAQLIRQGVKDVALQHQCHSDLMDEIASCKQWNEYDQSLIRAADERAKASDEEVQRIRIREGW